MKKMLLIFYLINVTLLSFSQGKWSVGLSFQPGTTGLIQREDPFPDSINFYKAPKSSTSINLIVDLYLTDRIQISSGYRNSKMSYSQEQNRDDVNLSLLEALGALNWMKTTYITSYYFMSIPLNIKFNLLKIDKLKIYLKGGVSTDFIKKANVEFINYYNDKPEERYTKPENNGKNNLMYSTNISLGLKYSLNNQYKVLIEPTYQYFFTKVDNSVPLKGHFYKTGVEFGFLYSF